MKFEACGKCPIKDTCNLIKMGIEERCSVNGGADWKIPVSTPKEETHIVFESDMAEDSLENEII